MVFPWSLHSMTNPETMMVLGILVRLSHRCTIRFRSKRAVGGQHPFSRLFMFPYLGPCPRVRAISTLTSAYGDDVDVMCAQIKTKGLARRPCAVAGAKPGLVAAPRAHARAPVRGRRGARHASVPTVARAVACRPREEGGHRGPERGLRAKAF